MSEKRYVENSKSARRAGRCAISFLDGMIAETDYCPIRKRAYRREWLAGRDVRIGTRLFTPRPFMHGPVIGVTT